MVPIGSLNSINSSKRRKSARDNFCHYLPSLFFTFTFDNIINTLGSVFVLAPSWFLWHWEVSVGYFNIFISISLLFSRSYIIVAFKTVDQALLAGDKELSLFQRYLPQNVFDIFSQSTIPLL